MEELAALLITGGFLTLMAGCGVCMIGLAVVLIGGTLYLSTSRPDAKSWKRREKRMLRRAVRAQKRLAPTDLADLLCKVSTYSWTKSFTRSQKGWVHRMDGEKAVHYQTATKGLNSQYQLLVFATAENIIVIRRDESTYEVVVDGTTLGHIKEKTLTGPQNHPVGSFDFSPESLIIDLKMFGLERFSFGDDVKHGAIRFHNGTVVPCLDLAWGTRIKHLPIFPVLPPDLDPEQTSWLWALGLLKTVQSQNERFEIRM